MKMAALTDLAIEWHFIGPIQSNKTRRIAENFAWVRSYLFYPHQAFPRLLSLEGED